MSRWTLVAVVFASGCGGGGKTLHGGEPDAATDATTATVIDAAPPDAAPAECPHRTAPPGIPDHTYPANEVHLGDVTAASPNDVSALAGIKVVSGNLTITDPDADISLPDLEVVEGNLEIHTDTLHSIHLPRLETVGWLFQSYRTPSYDTLDVAELPRFESSQQAVYLQVRDLEAPCIAQSNIIELFGVANDPLVLPALATTQNLQIGTSATRIDLPALASGELELNGEPQLVTLNLGAPDSVLMDSVPLLTSMSTSSTRTMSLAIPDAPLLTSLNGFATVTGFDELSVFNLPALTDISAVANLPVTFDLVLSQTGLATIQMPNVTAMSGELEINGNPSLTTLDLPNLRSLGPYDSGITNNPMLPLCQANAIKQRAAIPGGHTMSIIGNNGTGSCP